MGETNGFLGRVICLSSHLIYFPLSNVQIDMDIKYGGTKSLSKKERGHMREYLEAARK